MKNTKETKIMCIFVIVYLISVYGNFSLNSLLSNLFPSLSWIVTLLFYLIPVVIAVFGFLYFRKHKENISRTALLTGAVLLKYLLIPWYVFAIVMCLAALVMTISPLVFMAFAGPMIVLLMLVLSVLHMLGGSLFSVAYIMKAHKEGVHGTVLSLICTVCQFFFVADVIAMMVLTLKEKKNIIATIITVLLCVIVFFVSIAWLILQFIR